MTVERFPYDLRPGDVREFTACCTTCKDGPDSFPRVIRSQIPEKAIAKSIARAHRRQGHDAWSFEQVTTVGTLNTSNVR